MDSKEIAKYIGKMPNLRNVAYAAIFLTTLREWYIHSKLHQLLGSKKHDFKFLDAGSGMGQHAISVAKKFPNAEIIAYDVDSFLVSDCNQYISRCKMKNLTFEQCDLLNVAVKNNFDFILCGSVLEHIQHDMKILRQFYKALKNEGTILVYVPSREKRILSTLAHKQKEMIKNSGKNYLHDHVRYYSPEEITIKLQQAGFEIDDITITYGGFGALSYDIVTLVQYSSFFKYVFPLYLLLIHPFVLLLMLADFIKENHDGNGVMVIAHKKISSKF